MKNMKKIEKEIKEVEKEIDEYIHDISDIKIPTDKEFNKHKKTITSKVISCNYFTGVSPSNDIVYDVVFKYTVDNIIYRSKMQTTNKYNVGDDVDIYYYKKDPIYIKEINEDEEENNEFFKIVLLIVISLILIFIILLT